MKKLKFKILDGEKWWGGVVQHSPLLPFDKTTVYSEDLGNVFTNNQVNPLYFSNKGRFFYSEKSFKISFNKGVVIVDGLDEIIFGEEPTMFDAYKRVSKTFFKKSEFELSDELFIAPQFNTWIKFLYNQNQEGIIAYAKDIVNKGFNVGELIIDCGWQKYYGCWDFNVENFPNPSKMIEELHSMGFKVSLWLVPFISSDSSVYRDYLNKGLLLTNKDGSPLIVHWWDGYSAVLDFNNPNAVNEFKQITNYLIDKYKVDGFKMDAGDLYFYKDIEKDKGLPEEQTLNYAEISNNFKINELRACFKCGGESIIQRTADRKHLWDSDHGIKSLVPIACLQGLLGYFYSCPDMIGGGEIDNFVKSKTFSKELFVRYLEIASLMPCMQFSYDFWNSFEDDEILKLCLAYSSIRKLHKEDFIKLKTDAFKNMNPIVSYPELFGYNNLPYDSFIFGNDVIVCPIVEENCKELIINLPEGNWYFYGKTLSKGKYKIEAPLYVLPMFEKVGKSKYFSDTIMNLLNNYNFDLKVEKINE